MKKRILSIALSIVMLISLLPMTAGAATSYNLWVGGVQITSSNASNITGSGISGSVSYDAATNTLTLNNAVIAYPDQAIRTNSSDLIIELVGDNTVTGEYNNGNSTYGMYIRGDLSFTGNGSLTASSKDTTAGNSWSVAILAQGDITINHGCTITAICGSVGQYGNRAAPIYPYGGAYEGNSYISYQLVLNGAKVSVASENADGSSPVTYNPGSLSNYKYLKIEPASTYTVTFNANGYGTAPNPITNVTSGNTITAPTAPEADGWSFGGWYKEAECENAWNFSTDTVTANTTLYAKWTQAMAKNTTTGVSYATLAEALTAAADGNTVTLLAHCSENITIPAGVTFDGDAYTVSGTVTNNGTIIGGTFNDTVTNNGTLSGSGIYNDSVVNEGGTINGGIFYARVSNGLNSTEASLIWNGTFRGKVINYSNGTISGGSFQYAPSTNEAAVDNYGCIAGGIYDSTVDNLSGSSVAGATFKGDTTFRGGSTVAGGTYEKPVNIDSDTSNGIITVIAGEFNGSEAGVLYHGGVLDLSGVNPETFSVTIRSVYWGLETANVPVGTTNTGSNCIVLRTDMAAYRGNAEVSTINESNSAATVIKKREAPTSAEAPTIGTNLSTDEVTYVKDATATALNITASVTDGGTLTYQWYKNDEASTDGAQAIDGETGASYTPATSAAGTTYYYCVITNTKAGQTATVTSAIAMISVNALASTTYTVSYDTNGGSGFVVDNTVYESGDDVTVKPGDGLTKSGYTFADWNTKADGTGVSYEPGDIYTITADTTFYAQWTGDKNTAVDNTAAGSYAGTTVSGLDDLATKDEYGNAYPNNVTVEVKLTVTAKTENTALPAEVTAIKNAASGKTLQFLDLTLSRKVGSDPVEDIGDNNTQLLTIVIPFEKGSKQGITVYRYHGTQAEELTENPSVGAEGFVVGEVSITIYAKKFSTYAIGYTVPAPTPTPVPPIYIPPVHDCTSKCEVCGGCEDAKCGYSACEEKCVLLGMNFTDVEADTWYTDAVEYVYHRGMMDGVGNNRFDVNGTTTRAMIVTILWRLEGEPVVNYLMPFEDIPAESWYTEAVRWAASEKLIEGWNGKFGPLGEITREQFATILLRYAEYKNYDVSGGENFDILSYKDASSISEYAIPAMQWACSTGLMEGYDMHLTPKADASRVQAATLFQRFCENVAEK